MATFQPVLTRNYGVKNSHLLSVYREHGGYEALSKALAMGAENVVEEVKRAELRVDAGDREAAADLFRAMLKEKPPRYIRCGRLAPPLP